MRGILQPVCFGVLSVGITPAMRGIPDYARRVVAGLGITPAMRGILNRD